MPTRVRKIVGSILILLFVGAYAWAAVMIGALLPEHAVVQIIYYAVVGTAWGLPLIPLLSWMNRGR